jgi:hydrogenase-4 component B
MSPAAVLYAFFALCGLGILAAFVQSPRGNPALVAIVGSLASLFLLLFSGMLLVSDASFHATLWPVLSLASLTLSADRLAALFLFVSALVFLPVSLFSGVYLPKYLSNNSLRYFSVLYFSLFASVVLILIADDAISFLIGWEAMSIASYLLVTYDHEHEGSTRAGYIMLAMSEAGVIAVAIAFMLAAGGSGGLEFAALRTGAPQLGQGVRWAILLLSFFGFGVKAGLVPVNGWLPLAHPVAPTNVSALLSTVIVNLGIYGIIRINLDLVPVNAPSFGLVVLLIGSFSALVGILYATIQSEMKRLLAHSTIENMGIVAAGLGAAMVFLSSGHPVVAGIALIAALYHLGNHAIYKALLFMGTGAVEAGCGTRDLDKLGGIARRMPWTSALFLVGVLSIAALPPFNGFVSEWLTLQTILRSVLISSTATKAAFAVSGALLALTAGLAVTCFVKVYAMGFLGIARSDGAARAHESHLGMRVPLAFLALSCFALGVLPTYVIPVLDQTALPFTHASATADLVPPFFSLSAQSAEKTPPEFLAEFHNIGSEVGSAILPGRGLVVLHRGGAENPVVFAMSTTYTLVVLAGLLCVIYIVFGLVTRRRTVRRAAVWDGGLRRLWPGFTYTASGFSNPVRVVFQVLLQPGAVEDSTEAVARHFRTAIRRERPEIQVIDRLVLDVPVRALRRTANVVRRMHVGNVNAYAGYVLLTLLVVLIIGMTLI